MSQITQISDFAVRMIPYLRGCEAEQATQALEATIRDFCRDSGAWVEPLMPVAGVDWQAEYRFSHGYDAEVMRVRALWYNSQERTRHQYDYLEGSRIRFRRGYEPHDQDDDRLLRCAAAGSSFNTIALCQLVTDGSLTITNNDSDNAVTGLDFSGATDMDQVAQIIQTAWRDAQDDPVGYVQWFPVDESTAASGGYFVFWVTSGDIENLSADTTGTDISGTSYLNGLSTGDALLGPNIQIEAVMKPHWNADDIPDWFLNHWSETIMAGAFARLRSQPDQPWTNTAQADADKREYNNGWNRAKIEDAYQYKDGPCETLSPG